MQRHFRMPVCLSAVQRAAETCEVLSAATVPLSTATSAARLKRATAPTAHQSIGAGGALVELRETEVGTDSSEGSTGQVSGGQ